MKQLIATTVILLITILLSPRSFAEEVYCKIKVINSSVTLTGEEFQTLRQELEKKNFQIVPEVTDNESTSTLELGPGFFCQSDEYIKVVSLKLTTPDQKIRLTEGVDRALFHHAELKTAIENALFFIPECKDFPSMTSKPDRVFKHYMPGVETGC